MVRGWYDNVRAISRGAVFVAGLSILGCHSPKKAVEVSPDDPHLLYLGPFETRDAKRPRFAWPATEVRVRFQGTSVSVDLSDTPMEDETRQTDWIAVQIDDRPMTRLALSEGRKRYELSRGLSASEHTLRLIKRTEAEVGTITLHGFTLSPGAILKAVQRPKRRLLFVGDSISAGYGNEGANELCHYAPDTSDATRTFASLAAGELDAEAWVLAWSGKGVWQNFEGRDEGTMPTLFVRTLPGDAGSSEIRLKPEPSAVVVALGTNDFFRGVPDERAFMSAYRALLDKLASRAPHAPLLIVLGPMLADDYPQPHARSTLKRWLLALKREREQRGTKVDFIEQWIDPAEGMGCDFHPNLRTHARLARELSTALRSLMGW